MNFYHTTQRHVSEGVIFNHCYENLASHL